MAKSEEELRVQIEYNISGRTVNYALAAILGLGGYTFWPSDSDSKEINGINKQSIMRMQKDIESLKVSIEVVTTFMAENASARLEADK